MITITLDVPRGWLLTANQRAHWRVKAERTKLLRRSAWAATRGKATDPFPTRVRCTVLVSWPNRRRRDAHNLAPTLKACIDGMVDAGLLTDDSDAYLVGPDLRVSESLCDKGVACRLAFTFEEDR